MADGEVTVLRCFCNERLAAMGTRSLRYSWQSGGWYFSDAPTRSMSSGARYYALHERQEYKHTDHTGEPVIWIDCPWCGGVLPGGDG